MEKDGDKLEPLWSFPLSFARKKVDPMLKDKHSGPRSQREKWKEASGEGGATVVPAAAPDQ